MRGCITLSSWLTDRNRVEAAFNAVPAVGVPVVRGAAAVS